MDMHKNIIYGKEIIERWDTSTPELSYLTLKYGLTILDPNKIPSISSSFNPEHFKIDLRKLIEEIQNDVYSLSDKLFWLPEIEEITKKENILISEPEPDLYEPTDSEPDLDKQTNEVFEVRFSKSLTSETPKPKDTICDEIERHESKIWLHDNVFSLIGKVWFVKFRRGEWGLYPDHEKYKYIAHLLNLSTNNSGKGDGEFSINNTELVGKVKGTEIAEEYPGNHKQEDLNDSDLSEILSSDEVEKFKEVGYDLLDKLKKAKDSANKRLINEIQNEIDKYRSHLLNEYGIKSIFTKDGGDIYYKRLHRSSKENEKIRQVIKNQIRNAIKDFRDSMPKLRMHLNRSLKPQLYKTVYLPETHTSWHISM
ncbi:MAG: hypothetical protein JSW07_03360 [bacterium]|nr:MAG: hypothetical protein JSW07_03360 [bacterium]